MKTGERIFADVPRLMQAYLKRKKKAFSLAGAMIELPQPADDQFEASTAFAVALDGQLNSVIDRLPGRFLRPPRRRILGSVLFVAAPAFVAHVIAGLRGDPARYGSFLPRAEHMARRQAQADAWHSVRSQLAFLYDFACDQHLAAQADATQAALAVCERLKDEYRLAAQSGDRAWQAQAMARLGGLQRAWLLLAHARGQLKRTKRKPKPKPASPRQARASKREQEERRGASFTTFRRIFDRWGGR